MQYAIFKRRKQGTSLAPIPQNTPPKIDHTTNDRAVAQVFHCAGYVILPIEYAPLCELPDDEEEDGIPPSNAVYCSSIVRYSGIVELHHTGITVHNLEFWGNPAGGGIYSNFMRASRWHKKTEVSLTQPPRQAQMADKEWREQLVLMHTAEEEEEREEQEQEVLDRSNKMAYWGLAKVLLGSLPLLGAEWMNAKPGGTFDIDILRTITAKISQDDEIDWTERAEITTYYGPRCHPKGSNWRHESD